MKIRPKYITFDCYGTLTRFRMGDLARKMFADRIPAERMEQFIADFSAYRFDEVLGDWQPYETVLKNSLRRLCRKWSCSTSTPKRSSTTTRCPPGAARRRAGRAVEDRARDSARDPVERVGQPDPAQRREARRAVSTASTRRSSAGLQAAAAALRVHARFARLQTPKTCCTSRRACATT
jgi:hypothetical protein